MKFREDIPDVFYEVSDHECVWYEDEAGRRLDLRAVDNALRDGSWSSDWLEARVNSPKPGDPPTRHKIERITENREEQTMKGRVALLPTAQVWLDAGLAGGHRDEAWHGLFNAYNHTENALHVAREQLKRRGDGRVEIWQDGRVVGTIPTPKVSPLGWHTVVLGEDQPPKVELRGDPLATVRVKDFKVEWKTSEDGWSSRAVLHTDPMLGPGDLEDIVGFEHV